MKRLTNISLLHCLLIFVGWPSVIFSQEVAIESYSTTATGIVEISVNSSLDHYYLLQVKHDVNSAIEFTTAMVAGNAGTTILSESLEAYPVEHYRVLAYPIADPQDIDEDGIDDWAELQNSPDMNPINAAKQIDYNDGVIQVDSYEKYRDISTTQEIVEWSEFLNGREYVKYIIVNFDSKPEVYFLHNHELHADFAQAIGIDGIGEQVKKGQIIYHPSVESNNGTDGVFAFNYSNGHGQNFEVVQKTKELLAANMPFIENNLAYFVTANNEDEYIRDSSLYQSSRVAVLFEGDIYADVNYLGLHQAEGYGFFREMTLEEIPGTKDIVLYNALPNSLPRVGGIITSVIQTPLSHVNLRAIQNDIPNAYIRDPLANPEIANLLGEYIYYRVEANEFEIRQATVEEVNNWFEDIRPEKAQTPPLNLTYQSILPLSEIQFAMTDGFGAKCTNVATLGKLNFPENTIPDGYGVPFYFYKVFMEYNNFYEEAKVMMSQADFLADRIVRNDRLKDFRDKIKEAPMPDWMTLELAQMHASFPRGTSVRCRSSSNNEDLVGFNGAGLYTSKTQHPDEGAITKSIKQVYASLWNLRAFEERDFYRIDHFQTAMGVLCHPNFSNEKANGVGVTTDPIYNTNFTFYLNAQIGEDLITNPEFNSVPEELIVNRGLFSGKGYVVVQESNLVPENTMVISEEHITTMRDYFELIQSEFKILYGEEDNENFAMDIEYKITEEDQVVIKQARPWISYLEPESNEQIFNINSPVQIYPNPAVHTIRILCTDCLISNVLIANVMGQKVIEQTTYSSNSLSLSVSDLSAGIYLLVAYNENNEAFATQKFMVK